MTHVLTLHYDKPLLRRAVFRFWSRVIGFPFWIAMALAAAFVVAQIQKGDRSWMMGAGAAGLTIVFVMAITILVVHYRNSMIKFRAMRVPEATFTASDESFTVSSELGSSTLRWSSITEVWQYPEFYLVFFSKAQFITLPLADLPAEARAFVLERIRDAGGKVR